MPVFKVTDPQGRVLRLEGDHQPTEQELSNIFQEVFPTPAESRTETAAPVTAIAPERPSSQMSPEEAAVLHSQAVAKEAFTKHPEILNQPLVNLPPIVPDWIKLSAAAGMPGAPTAVEAAARMTKPISDTLSGFTSLSGAAQLPLWYAAPGPMAVWTAARTAPEIPPKAQETLDLIKQRKWMEALGSGSELGLAAAITAAGPLSVAAPYIAPAIKNEIAARRVGRPDLAAADIAARQGMVPGGPGQVVMPKPVLSRSEAELALLRDVAESKLPKTDEGLGKLFGIDIDPGRQGMSPRGPMGEEAGAGIGDLRGRLAVEEVRRQRLFDEQRMRQSQEWQEIKLQHPSWSDSEVTWEYKYRLSEARRTDAINFPMLQSSTLRGSASYAPIFSMMRPQSRPNARPLRSWLQTPEGFSTIPATELRYGPVPPESPELYLTAPGQTIGPPQGPGLLQGPELPQPPPPPVQPGLPNLNIDLMRPDPRAIAEDNIGLLRRRAAAEAVRQQRAREQSQTQNPNAPENQIQAAGALPVEQREPAVSQPESQAQAGAAQRLSQSAEEKAALAQKIVENNNYAQAAISPLGTVRFGTGEHLDYGRANQGFVVSLDPNRTYSQLEAMPKDRLEANGLRFFSKAQLDAVGSLDEAIRRAVTGEPFPTAQEPRLRVTPAHQDALSTEVQAAPTLETRSGFDIVELKDGGYAIRDPASKQLIGTMRTLPQVREYIDDFGSILEENKPPSAVTEPVAPPTEAPPAGEVSRASADSAKSAQPSSISEPTPAPKEAQVLGTKEVTKESETKTEEKGKEGLLEKSPGPDPGTAGRDTPQLGMGMTPRFIETFIRDDVKPFIEKGKDATEAFQKGVMALFSPASLSRRVLGGSAEDLYAAKGHAEKVNSKIQLVMDDAYKMMRNMPQDEQVGFIDRMKLGQRQPTPDLQQVADLLRKWDNVLYDEPLPYAPDTPYLQNHMRILWKVIPGSPEALGALSKKTGLTVQQLRSRRPWRGTQGWRRQMVFDTFTEGLQQGGVPVTYNPMEMFFLHAQDVMKFVAANKAFRALKANGNAVYGTWRTIPDGFVKMEDPIFKAYFTPTTLTPSGARVPMRGVRAQAGEWWVRESDARMIRNYLSRDYIRTNPFLNALMEIKNATTAVELGLSPFHWMFESFETASSSLGLGLAKLTTPGQRLQGLRDIVTSPFSPFTTAKTGGKAIRYFKDAAAFKAADPKGYDWFTKNYPGADQLIDDLFTGGGQLKMNDDWRFGFRKGFSQAMKEGNYVHAVFKALPDLHYKLFMKPLFETYIPRLKVGMFLREYSYELTRNSEAIRTGAKTRNQLAIDTWRFVEDRFGEMNFDNLFWDRTFKSAMQFLFRSVTWKLGNIRGFGAATKDAFKGLITDPAKALGQGQLPPKPNVTLPMTWLVGMTLNTAITSAVLSKLFTNQYPWELAKDVGDLFLNLAFPRVSPNDPSQRVSVPTYLRDAVHFSHGGLLHGPVNYISASFMGEIGRVLDVWNNKDFYGTAVYNPDDPLKRKIGESFWHMAPLPFGISSFIAQERTGATPTQKALSFTGFTKAPYYVSYTLGEQKALELIRSRLLIGARTREAFEKSVAERQALEAIKRGDMTSGEAVTLGLVQPNRQDAIRQQSQEPLMVHAVRRLDARQAVDLYEAASLEERSQIEQLVREKIRNSRTITGPERDRLTDRFLKALLETR